MPAGARNVSLNITTFSVDDRGVLLLNDSIIGSTGIGGPGWGEMALTADGPSLPFNFQYGNNNAPFSVLNLFVTGWNELSLIVNNTGQGIFDGLSTLGSSSATVIGTVTFDVGSVPVPPPGPSAGPSPLPTFIITTSNFVPGLLIPGEPQISFTTVPGNLLFQPGVTYSVYLNATDTTYAVVSGTASLAGTVNAQFLPGSYTAKQYDILTSAGLNGTTFGALNTSNLPANFIAGLSYTSTDVLLNLTAALGNGTNLNNNQQTIANAINTSFNNGGSPLPPGFSSIFGLTGNALANALSQLSGEAATGAQRGAFQLTNQFLDIMRNGWAVMAKFDGEFANRSQTYAGLDPFVRGGGGMGEWNRIQ